jgi:DNA-binding transcriptional LysR family regulator
VNALSHGLERPEDRSRRRAPRLAQRAARALGTTQPTVSRRLAGFERKTGVKLFVRRKDGLTPTQLGAALTDGLNLMDEGALAVERRIASRDTGLQGPITVTSLDWLGDWATASSCQSPPDLAASIIAFRFGSFEQEDLVLRKVADAAYGLYASPEYLERQGSPNFVRSRHRASARGGGTRLLPRLDKEACPASDSPTP